LNRSSEWIASAGTGSRLSPLQLHPLPFLWNWRAGVRIRWRKRRDAASVRTLRRVKRIHGLCELLFFRGDRRQRTCREHANGESLYKRYRVAGLAFLSLGCWTTDFLMAHRAFSAKSLRAAQNEKKPARMRGHD